MDESTEPPSPTQRRQLLLEEWKNVQEDLRHFGTKRFLQLTVFVAVTGFLFEAASKTGSIAMHASVGGLGFVLAVAFWMMEQSTAAYVAGWIERSRELEEEIGLKLIRTKVPSRKGWHKLVRATTWTYVIYLVITLCFLGIVLVSVWRIRPWFA